MGNGGNQRNITVFGHRGARGIYPENTMAGFQYLQDIGINAVEFDVQNAANRITILAHDPHVTMPDGANGEVRSQLIRHTKATDITKLKVGALRPGSNYAIQFPDQARLPDARIPTFANFCTWAAQHPLLMLNVEVKSHAEQVDLYDPPEMIVSDVVDLLEKHNLCHRCVLSSFDWRVLLASAKRAPELTRGYLTLEQNPYTTLIPNIFDGSSWMGGVTRADHNGSLPQTIAALGGKVWCPYYKELTPDALVRAQDLGLVVNVWTVNTLDDIHRMADMGVNGIISDYPARVQNVLAQYAGV